MAIITFTYIPLAKTNAYNSPGSKKSKKCGILYAHEKGNTSSE